MRENAGVKEKAGVGLFLESGSDRLYLVQRKIARRVILEDDFSLELPAGVDQAFLEAPGRELVVSGCVAGAGGRLMKSHSVMAACHPYVPGLLFFREGPAAVRAARALSIQPTLLFVDGCGVNHPRGAGLASMIGVLMDLPTIGISKWVLCGEHEPLQGVGDASPLCCRDRVAGYVLQSKKGCRPIVVAPGHRISPESALEAARMFLKDHKLPEPCRLAHLHANAVRDGLEESIMAPISRSGPGGHPGPRRRPPG
ncbi:MAG: endonuclease V [Methanosarcinales archaeon]|nr:endonuclease V [Methanosarcinales archaeon]